MSTDNIYTTVGEYQAQHDECTGEFVDQNGDVMGSDARITVSFDGSEWCPGWYDGNSTWEPMR